MAQDLPMGTRAVTGRGRAAVSRGFETRAVHDGHAPGTALGALNPPVFASSTFVFGSLEEADLAFTDGEGRYVYHRVSNPTVAAFEKKMASLEEGEACVATSSGIGALAAVLLSFIAAGDTVLCDATLYGSTVEFLNGLERMGVAIRWVDMTDLSALQEAARAPARAALFETPCNPNLRIIDIVAVAEICRRRGIWTVVDNTFATPYLQRPISLGADIVIESATKYLCGAGDVLGGVVISRRSIIEQVRTVGLKDMTGACLSPFDAHLLLRGTKTLALRMERHCQSAARLAERLTQHPAIRAVRYPGLASHAGRHVAASQMRLFGGLVAFELKGGAAAVSAFIANLAICRCAVSLGCAETLVQHPASMTHRNQTPEQKAKAGWGDDLVRVSVGLETYEDIEADILDALAYTSVG